MDMSRKPLYKLKPIDPEETIGQRVSRIRKSKGLTQVDVSQRIGITQALYSSYERGRLRLSAEMVAQIALVLKTSADEILGLQKNTDEEMADRGFLRRMKKIETLSRGQRKMLFSNIDMFLKGALETAKPQQETFTELRENR